MAKIDKQLKSQIDGLADDALARTVDELKLKIPELNAKLDYAARLLRERRAAALKRAVDVARGTAK